MSGIQQYLPSFSYRSSASSVPRLRPRRWRSISVAPNLSVNRSRVPCRHSERPNRRCRSRLVHSFRMSPSHPETSDRATAGSMLHPPSRDRLSTNESRSPWSGPRNSNTSHRPRETIFPYFLTLEEMRTIGRAKGFRASSRVLIARDFFPLSFLSLIDTGYHEPQPLGVYIHWPFCAKICPELHFQRIIVFYELRMQG